MPGAATMLWSAIDDIVGGSRELVYPSFLAFCERHLRKS